jgi:hypothetical protein
MLSPGNPLNSITISRKTSMYRFILAAAILTLSPLCADAGGGGGKQRTGSVEVHNPFADRSISTAVVTTSQYNQLRQLIDAGNFSGAESLFISFGPQAIAGGQRRTFSNLRAGQYRAVGDDLDFFYESSQFEVRSGQRANATLARIQ